MCLFLQEEMRNTSQVCALHDTLLSKWFLPLATVGKGHDKHFPYSTESQADLRPNNSSFSYIPIFVWARSAFGLLAHSWCPAECRKHAWSERLFLLVIKFMTKLSLFTPVPPYTSMHIFEVYRFLRPPHLQAWVPAPDERESDRDRWRQGQYKCPSLIQRCLIIQALKHFTFSPAPPSSIFSPLHYKQNDNHLLYKMDMLTGNCHWCYLANKNYFQAFHSNPHLKWVFAHLQTIPWWTQQ